MFDFLLAGTVLVAAIGFVGVLNGARNTRILTAGHEIDIQAGFGEFHKFMTIFCYLVVCGIPLALFNILKDGDPVTDMMAMTGIYLLLLYFILSIFNRKVILTARGAIEIDLFGNGRAIGNEDLAGARLQKKTLPIRAARFTTRHSHITVDEQMINYHQVVAELRNRASR
ncbi:hypothetical protein [Massilia sp. DD77]|uniref:hypothetical protein n=1 Tax=Massilia sp. DD77 TaxID=3109349 RepID=UPI003000EAC8